VSEQYIDFRMHGATIKRKELGCIYHAIFAALYVLLQFAMSPDSTNIL